MYMVHTKNTTRLCVRVDTQSYSAKHSQLEPGHLQILPDDTPSIQPMLDQCRPKPDQKHLDSLE